MKGALSYALFGYGKDRAHNCYDFASYMRGLHISIRFNRLLFPDWITVLNLDSNTYNSPYKKVFDWHVSKGWLQLNMCPDNEPLCKAMLWRLKTVFEYDHPEWRFTHVICRDLDSISTFREMQMVEEWISEDKAMHCITDSISHTIPMLGGLVGFRPGYVNDIMKITTNPKDAWDKLIAMAPGIDYRVKGSDQDFMNRVMYPKLCHSATEHFIKGRPHDLVEGNGRHYRVPEGNFGRNPKFVETNLLCGHCGSSGFYEAPTMKFLFDEDPNASDYLELESLPEFDKLFYWQYREDLR